MIRDWLLALLVITTVLAAYAGSVVAVAIGCLVIGLDAGERLTPRAKEILHRKLF